MHRPFEGPSSAEWQPVGNDGSSSGKSSRAAGSTAVEMKGCGRTRDLSSYLQCLTCFGRTQGLAVLILGPPLLYSVAFTECAVYA